VSKGARAGDIGGVLAAVGGFAVALGAPLPWENLVYPGPPVPGCFGCGYASLFDGTDMANGRVAMAAGAGMAMAGLFVIAYPAARRWTAVGLAAAVVVAAAAVGGWWLNNMSVAVITTFAVEACSLLLGLAAVPLCLPGPARQRLPLLAATVILCVIGAILARPGSTREIVMF